MQLKKTLVAFVARNWLIIAIVFLAAFLRLFYYMGVIRGDDFFYTYYAHKFAEGELSQFSGYPGIKRPGLYVPAAILFNLFGESEFITTLFPLLASLATIIFIYKIASMLAGGNAGIVSAFLWSVFTLDIFMATQLDPEAPLAMAATGSVFFLLAASRRGQGMAGKTIYFAASGAFLVWALLIKLSSSPLIFVLIFILVYDNWLALKRLSLKIRGLAKPILWAGSAVIVILIVFVLGFALSKQPWPVVVNNLELTATDSSSSWILGRINPTQRNQVGGNWVKVKRDVFTPPPQPDALTRPTGSQRLSIFDLYAPIFIVAAAYTVLQRNRAAYVPLIWFAIMFFYLEWGPFPRSLSPSKILIYTPINHWVATDNFLLFSAPMILVIGIYIARGLEKQKISSPILASILTILPTVLLLENLPTRNLILNYMNVVFVFALVCVFASPFVLLGKIKTRWNKTVLFAVLIPVMGIAALIPSPPYHVWDFFKEQDRRKNLQAVNAYLLEHQDLPVHARSGGLTLEVYSEFQYGYAFMNEGYSYPATRMTADRTLITRMGGYFLMEGCGRAVTRFEDWPLAEFGDPSSTECISLVRRLPAEKAEAELAKTQQAALQLGTQEAFFAYLNSSANSANFEHFVKAFSLIVSNFPEEAPIVQASGLIVEQKEIASVNSLDILSSFDEDRAAWTFGPLLAPHLVQERGSQLLAVGIRGTVEDIQPIMISLTLKPATAYLLKVELRSSASFDLVRFQDENIPDSFPDGWNKALSWTAYSIAFVTPDWPQDQQQVTLELARVYDRGIIRFRTINLIEFPTANLSGEAVCCISSPVD